MSKEVPIFALGTVLFPRGMLPLRVFEPRYVDMIKECMRNGTAFGVVCIRDGEEMGEAPSVFDVGTYARIVDFDLLEDGLLGVTAAGDGRFRIHTTEVRPNQLLVATEVSAIAEDEDEELPDDLAHLAQIVEEIYTATKRDLPEDDAQQTAWIGNRIAEVLPIPLGQKQHLLELTDPVLRLREVNEVVVRLSEQGDEETGPH
jgi:uncharacterized protein